MMGEREKHYSRCGFGLAAVALVCAAFAGIGHAQTDDFATWRAGLSTPAEHGVEITPHDTLATFLSTNTGFKTTRGVYVGTSGDLTVVLAGGEEVTFADAPAGYHPLRVDQVKSTGTTATDIVAVW